VRRLHDPRCDYAPKSERPCLQQERPYHITEDGGVPICKKHTCMHICAHVLLQVYACMRRMPIQGKQGDHVMYKITRANSMEKYTKSKQGRRWCPRFVRAAIPTHARTYHEKQARGTLRRNSRLHLACALHRPWRLHTEPAAARPRRPRRLDHTGYFDNRLLSYRDPADSAMPTTSTTVCSATATPPTPPTRPCRLLQQPSAWLRRLFRLGNESS
jgi:hypothetical protein